MSYLILAVVVLASGSLLSLMMARWPRVALACACAAIVSAGVLAIRAAIPVLLDAGQTARVVSWPLPLGAASLRLDPLSAWFLVAAGLLSSAAAIYSWGYLQDQSQPPRMRVGTYGCLLCLMLAALLTVFTAADTILFLIAWELLSLCAFFLVLFNDEEPQTRRGAWVYLIATHLGSALSLMPMFATLVAHSHDTAFASFAAALATAPPRLAVVLFLLGLVGFGTKAGFMPMHVWLPHAHPVAPSPVSALLSGIVIKAGIYGLLRLLSWLGPLPVACAIGMLSLGAVTGIMGILYAASQHQLKRMLAYSSVENIGIIGIGIGAGMLGSATGYPMLATLGFAGALLHVLNHALFKGLLFLSAGTVLHATGTAQIDRLGGLARKTPANAFLFLVGVVAICALPPFNGLVGEWLIYNALFRGALSGASWAWSPIVALTALALIGGLALASFAKVFSIIFLGEPRDPHIHPHPTPKTMIAGPAILAVACAAVGAGSPLLIPLLSRACAVLASGHAEQVRPPDELTDVMVPLSRFSGAIAVLVFATLVLLGWRKLLGARGQNVAGRPTWGCGHPYADPRVQYTGSSFITTLVHSFQPLLRTRTQLTSPAGYFPKPGRLETHTPDAVDTRAYQPLFAWIERLCQRLWPLQQGRVQLYLIYILLALLSVFVVEACWSPYATPSQMPTRTDPVPVVVQRGDHP